MTRDDLIKDLAGERRRKRRRCQQQEEEAELEHHSANPAHSHPDHTSVLLAAAATKLDFFFFRPLGAWLRKKGVGPPRTGSRKCHVELHLNISTLGFLVTVAEHLRAASFVAWLICG